MTGQAKKNCWGCVHRQSRLRGSTPRSWCARYHTTTNVRCEDYRFKSVVVRSALRFFQKMGIK